MLLTDYIYWHYVIAPAGILGLLKNFLLGVWHKFLIATHFKTLLAPWHRVQPSGIGTTRTFGDKIINGVIDFYIRIIAAIIRLVIILAGLFVGLIIIAGFFILLVVWLLWPAVFIFWVGKGLGLVF